MRDTLIASKLRGAGLKVVEVAGWQNRGSDNFNPKGFVWHHTAGPAKGNAPSLAICTNGRSGLPGLTTLDLAGGPDSLETQASMGSRSRTSEPPRSHGEQIKSKLLVRSQLL